MPSSPHCAKPETSSTRGRFTAASVVMISILVLWTALLLPCGLGMALLSVLWPGRFSTVNRRNIWRYGRSVLWLLHPWLPVILPNADMAVRHAGILICNHQSFWDIYLLSAQAQSNLCLVAKRWPFRLLFFFAPAMRSAGYIDAESLSPEAVAVLCRQRLAEGATLVIFPEGQRTRTGALGRFRVGAFVLAAQTGIPLLPLVIHNSYQAYPPGARHFTPTCIRMEFLEPVWPQAFADALLPHRAMLRHVRQLYARRLAAPISSLKEKSTQ